MEEIRKKLRIMLGEPDENGCFYEVSEQELLALFSQSNKELVGELEKEKYKKPTKYHEDKEEEKLCKLLGHPCKAKQYEFRDKKISFNAGIELAISKIKEKGSIKE